MYLGFLIHMFLHFVIIETEIVKQSGARVRDSTVPSYGALYNNPSYSRILIGFRL